MKRNKQRRRANAAIDRVLDELEDRYCAKVAAAVDFARLDAVEQSLIDELDQLIAAGKLPAPPDRRALQGRASAMINWALSIQANDPRRTKHDVEDECDLCRAFGTGTLLS